ncbi:hypothetical protein J2W92_002307 [Rhizobium leguminosarum]
MKAAPATDALPLFSWPEQTEIAVLDAERRSLIARIGKMRICSERRVKLEAELKRLTEEQLRLSSRLTGKRK